MMQSRPRALACALLLAGAAAATGCSSGVGEPAAKGSLETTGTIEAQLTTVPGNVRCVHISAYGATYIDSFTDVTPKTNATIHIGPLDPGNYYLYGSAYDISCAAVHNGDAGGGTGQTWTAEQTSVFVAAGDSVHTDLRFFPLGSLNVVVSFDSCADAGSSSLCNGNEAGTGIDAGVDGSFSEASVIHFGDASFIGD